MLTLQSMVLNIYNILASTNRQVSEQRKRKWFFRNRSQDVGGDGLSSPSDAGPRTRSRTRQESLKGSKHHYQTAADSAQDETCPSMSYPLSVSTTVATGIPAEPIGRQLR